MNLPRTVRFKRQNVIIVGIIPGPTEPRHDELNNCLEPLVTELSDIWVGVSMSVQIGGTTSFKTVRGAVLCSACGLPAGRKVCGFLSYSGSHGCSKCFKSFGGKVGSMNYSGFDRSLWTPRTNDKHRKDVKAVLRGTSKSSKAEIESKIGCRYTVLL